MYTRYLFKPLVAHSKSELVVLTIHSGYQQSEETLVMKVYSVG